MRLDLFRIDLSAVVSKYIGETEKNLRRVFDAAEEGGAVLLFDEADALFGKRSEVKDSHDRYANVEISYLLQRMEAYRGLAILTTNMKEALDPAFLRRLRFIVQFPFPDQAQRAEIWRRIFPAKTPTEQLDLAALSRLSISGGNIRSIALNAAFAAADATSRCGCAISCAPRASNTRSSKNRSPKRNWEAGDEFYQSADDADGTRFPACRESSAKICVLWRDNSSSISPREIEVHIDELILHGFTPRDRWQIGDALEHELRGLLAARGIPATWLSSPERIDTGFIRTMSLNKPAAVGSEIASAVYRNEVSELTNKQRR